MTEISKEISCQREQNSTDDKPSAIELARIAEVRKRKPEANLFEVMPSAADIALSESILSKTHYGLTIYSHILQLYYPDEVVLRLVGRDCGLCRNPFNADKETLHIWIEKENILGNVLDKEQARHEDNTNAIPTGNAFDLAELHYKQQGNELLQTINHEMNLRIGEERNFYRSAQKSIDCSELPRQREQRLNLFKSMPSVADNIQTSQFKSLPLGKVEEASFSFFKAPIINTKPHKAVSLLQIYNAIKGDYYKDRIQKLRAISDVGQARKYKAANFDYCTFSGTFTTRNDKALIKHSELLCVDFDHLQNLNDLKSRLLADEYFDTQLLFVSPSGDGLKWIIPIDTTATPHSQYFAAIANYIQQTYGVEVDKSGRDISRACFLPYDPQVYINPTYLK